MKYLNRPWRTLVLMTMTACSAGQEIELSLNKSDALQAPKNETQTLPLACHQAHHLSDAEELFAYAPASSSIDITSTDMLILTKTKQEQCNGAFAVKDAQDEDEGMLWCSYRTQLSLGIGQEVLKQLWEHAVCNQQPVFRIVSAAQETQNAADAHLPADERKAPVQDLDILWASDKAHLLRVDINRDAGDLGIVTDTFFCQADTIAQDNCQDADDPSAPSDASPPSE